MTDLATLEAEAIAVEDDIVAAYATLGRLLATPAINQIAGKRREHAIRVQREEIMRMQRLQAEIGLEIRAAGS